MRKSFVIFVIAPLLDRHSGTSLVLLPILTRATYVIYRAHYLQIGIFKSLCSTVLVLLSRLDHTLDVLPDRWVPWRKNVTESVLKLIPGMRSFRKMYVRT